MKMLAFVMIISVTSACSQTQKITMNEFIHKVNNATVRSNEELDSVLQVLQQQNDLLLVFADENFAWTRTSTYYILAKNKEQWKGYYYKGSNRQMPVPKNETNFVTINVSQDEADSVLNYFNANNLWEVPGDNGKNFCNNDSSVSGNKPVTSKCNIYDANTWQLFMITKTKVISPSYYAPEFYERCCPGNMHRKHFVEAAKKIKDLVSIEKKPQQ